MPAYMIAIRRGPVRDTAAMDEYQRRTRAMPPGARLVPRVIYGNILALEGAAPDGMVIIEFPTLAEAEAWYRSEAYQAAIPFRQKAADYDVFMVEGIDR